MFPPLYQGLSTRPVPPQARDRPNAPPEPHAAFDTIERVVNERIAAVGVPIATYTHETPADDLPCTKTQDNSPGFTSKGARA